MMRTATRIKICGITRLPDAEAVAEAGADALGLMFAEQSTRWIDVDSAERIANAVTGRVCVVAVFLNPEADQVRQVLDRMPVDLLQFHGDEADGFCAGFDVPYMKAHRVRAPVDADELERIYPNARWHLLDAYVPGQAGGTGRRFDWTYWPESAGRSGTARYALCGGLTPENVGDAIRRVRPDAVDVSGGVESATRGIKDADRIRAFVDAVRATDREVYEGQAER
jgi:phosphoribosylanthranilate isomerase